MLGSSGAGARETGPSSEKPKKKQKTPRRARVRVLASVGAVVIAVAAIATTTWALSRGGEDESADPPGEHATTASGTTSINPNPWAPEEAPSPTAPYSLPSYPTPSSTDDPEATAPSLTFPTPSTGSTPYTPPAYTPPAYTPPAYTPPTTTPPTTAPTTTPPPSPTAVRPVAPQATKITRCGTWGSLQVVKTTGVRYERTVGDGRQGRWVVRASARKGYVIASGARTRWEGNLGKHRPCPGDPTIDEVTKVSTDDPEPGTWDLTVATTVPGARDRALALTFVFTTEASVGDSAGEGWSCQEGPVAAGTPTTCTYTGDAPPDVTLSVRALDGDQAVEPQGTLALTTDGKVTDDSEF